MDWERIKRCEHEEVIAWAESQSWAKAISACARDVQWHAEGDVLTHTKMVWEQLSGVDGWDDASDVDQLALLFTALFHDAVKPLSSTLDLDCGYIRSPNDAVKGEHLARGVLRVLQCDLATRERIWSLVRYHGRPVFLLERKQPIHEVIRLS